MLFIVHLEKRILVHRKLSDIQRNLGVSDSVTLLKLKEDQEIERNVPEIQGTFVWVLLARYQDYCQVLLDSQFVYVFLKGSNNR